MQSSRGSDPRLHALACNLVLGAANVLQIPLAEHVSVRPRAPVCGQGMQEDQQSNWQTWPLLVRGRQLCQEGVEHAIAIARDVPGLHLRCLEHAPPLIGTTAPDPVPYPVCSAAPVEGLLNDHGQQPTHPIDVDISAHVAPAHLLPRNRSNC